MDLDFQPENPPPKSDKLTGQPPPVNGASMIGPQPAGQQAPTPSVKSTVAPPPPPLQPFDQTAPKRSKLPILLVLLLLLVIAAVVLLVVLPRLGQSPQPTTTLPPQEEVTTPTAPLPSTTTPAGRDAQRKSDLKKIETLLSAYFSDNQSYPIVPEIEKLNISTNITVKALVPKYSASLPVDPLDSEFWYGYKSTDGKTYELSARLEDSSDVEAVLVGSKYLYFLKK